MQVGFGAPAHIPAGAAVIPEHRGAAWHNPAETAPQYPPLPTPCCIRDPQSPGAHRLPGGRRGRAPAAQHQQDGWAWPRRELEGFDLGVCLFFPCDSFSPFYFFFFPPFLSSPCTVSAGAAAMIWRQRAPGRCFIAPLRRVTATLRPAAWSPVGETSGLGHAWRGGGRRRRHPVGPPHCGEAPSCSSAPASSFKHACGSIPARGCAGRNSPARAARSVGQRGTLLCVCATGLVSRRDWWG